MATNFRAVLASIILAVGLISFASWVSSSHGIARAEPSPNGPAGSGGSNGRG